MAPSYVNPTTTVILYERLDVSIVELETKRSGKIVWTGVHNKEEATLPFLLPKTSMIHDLAEHIAKQVTLTPLGSGKIRVFEVSKDGKTQKEFTGSEMIGNIPDPVELYAEEIPVEELEADDADKIISVFHFSKEVQRTHGVPFKFVVKPVCYAIVPEVLMLTIRIQNEKFFDTKRRLQARIGVSDKDLAKYRFALIQVATFKQPSYIEDGKLSFPEHGSTAGNFFFFRPTRRHYLRPQIRTGGCARLRSYGQVGQDADRCRRESHCHQRLSNQHFAYRNRCI